jgi:ribonuclease D
MMNYTLIESDNALASLVTQHGDTDTVIVDTEFMRRDTFYPQAGLIQLCFASDPEMAWLVDPLPIDDFRPLCDLFADESVTKVVHSASEDLEVFQKLLDQQPLPLFDTQRAAAFVGLGFGLGYRALVENLAGITIEKDQTRSDWLARPLSTGQLNYAAADVVPLLPIYRELRERLQQQERLQWVLEDGAEAVRSAAASGPPPYLRVKTAWKLDARQLAVLQSICNWRESRARSTDKPRNWILHDKLCQQLSERAPQSIDDLRSISEMPPSVVRKQGERLIELVREVLEMPESELPPPLARPLNAAQRDSLKKLKKAAGGMAADWGIESAAILPAKDYELLVRLGGGETVETPDRWNGWRRELVIEPLLRLLDKESVR